MPLWGKLRKFSIYNRALPGLNAAAVGLLVLLGLGHLASDSGRPTSPRARTIMALGTDSVSRNRLPAASSSLRHVALAQIGPR